MNSFTSLRHKIPRYLNRRFEGKVGLQKIVINTGWLFTDKVISIFVGLLVSAWVARYLGPALFGIYNYSFAIVALITPIVGLGLRDIVIRNIVRQPEEKGAILGTSFSLQFATGLLAMGLSVLIVLVLRPDDFLVWILIAIMAGSLVISTFGNTLDFWFQSQIQSKYTVLARNIALIIIASVKIILILNQAPLEAFAWSLLAEMALLGLVLAIFYKITGENFSKWKGSLKQAYELLQDSWPLIISGISVVVYMKIDQVMLGNMLGETTLGIYSAAVRLSELWYFIPIAIASSIYPSIIRSRESLSNASYNKRLQVFFDIMALVAYAIVIPFTLIAPFLVNIVFGAQYADAGAILRVHIWAYIFVSLGVARNRWFMVENMTRFPMYAAFLGAIVNIGLNIWLIPKFAGLGSAWATLISYCVSSYLSTPISIRLWPLFKQLSLSLLVPFRIRSLWKTIPDIVSE